VNSLAFMLEEQGISTRHASTCGEAALVLRGENPPHLVFADTRLEDGRWVDIVALARQVRLPVNVIVVSSVVDVSLHLNTIDHGAFDFITPPFEPRDVSHIVRCAVSDVVLRRKNLAELSVSNGRPACPMMPVSSVV